MAENDVEINITADAKTTAIQKTEKELGQLEQQAKDASEATAGATAAPAGVGDELAEKFADAKKRVDALKEGYSELKESTGQLNTGAGQLDTGMGKLNTTMKGVAAVSAAEAFGQLMVSLEAVSGALKDTDPELAKTAEGIVKLGEAATNVAGAAAAGFATGGPWGGLIARTLAIGGEAVKFITNDLEKLKQAAKESAEEAVKAGAKLQEAMDNAGRADVSAAIRDINKLKEANQELATAAQENLDIDNLRAEGRRAALLQGIEEEEAAARARAAQGLISQEQLANQLEELADARAVAKEQSELAKEQLRTQQAEVRLAAEQKLLADVQDEIARAEKLRAELRKQYAEEKKIALAAAATARAAPENITAANTADRPANEAGKTSAKLDQANTDIQKLKGNLSKAEDAIDNAVAHLGRMQSSVEEGMNQIAAAADSEAIIEKTNELTTAAAAQSTAATDTLKQAQAGIDQEIERFREAGKQIPVTLATQQNEVLKLLNDSIPDALQIKEITNVIGELKKEQANFSNALLTGLSGLFTSLQKSQRTVDQLNREIEKMKLRLP
jgi:putative membrane protein